MSLNNPQVKSFSEGAPIGVDFSSDLTEMIEAQTERFLTLVAELEPNELVPCTNETPDIYPVDVSGNVPYLSFPNGWHKESRGNYGFRVVNPQYEPALETPASTIIMQPASHDPSILPAGPLQEISIASKEIEDRVIDELPLDDLGLSGLVSYSVSRISGYLPEAQVKGENGEELALGGHIDQKGLATALLYANAPGFEYRDRATGEFREPDHRTFVFPSEASGTGDRRIAEACEHRVNAGFLVSGNYPGTPTKVSEAVSAAGLVRVSLTQLMFPELT